MDDEPSRDGRHRADDPGPAGSTDPELIAQMDASTAGPIEAVVAVAEPAGEAMPSADRTEQLADELVARVGKIVGRPVEAMQVFRHLGRFAVSADADFLRELIAQPEVVRAVANRRGTTTDPS